MDDIKQQKQNFNIELCWEKEREIFNGWKQRSFKAKKLSTGRDVTAVQKLATKAKAIMTEILCFNDHKGSGHVLDHKRKS